jgi:hypothetical protein
MISRSQRNPPVHECVLNAPIDVVYRRDGNTVEKCVIPFEGDVYLEKYSSLDIRYIVFGLTVLLRI